MRFGRSGLAEHGLIGFERLDNHRLGYGLDGGLFCDDEALSLLVDGEAPDDLTAFDAGGDAVCWLVDQRVRCASTLNDSTVVTALPQ